MTGRAERAQHRGMVTWVKVLLGVAGGLVALVVALAFVAFSIGQPMQEGAMRSVQEGEAWAREHRSSECLSEALGRMRRDGSWKNSVAVHAFFMGCVAHSRDPREVCAGVPANDKLPSATAWRQQECARSGMASNSHCAALLLELQGHCDKTKSDKVTSAEQAPSPGAAK